MNIEEFIEKEAQKYKGVNSSSYNFRVGFSEGLTKGLQIADDLLIWASEQANDYIAGEKSVFDKTNGKVTPEILKMYLTEKYGK